MPEGAVSEPWGDVWEAHLPVLRGQQAQQALWPPNPLSLGPQEVDPFLWELVSPAQASSRQGDTEEHHSEWWGLCWRQGYPQSRGTK